MGLLGPHQPLSDRRRALLASLSCATAANISLCLNRSRIAARSVTASLREANQQHLAPSSPAPVPAHVPRLWATATARGLGKVSRGPAVSAFPASRRRRRARVPRRVFASKRPAPPRASAFNDFWAASRICASALNDHIPSKWSTSDLQLIRALFSSIRPRALLVPFLIRFWASFSDAAGLPGRFVWRPVSRGRPPPSPTFECAPSARIRLRLLFPRSSDASSLPCAVRRSAARAAISRDWASCGLGLGELRVQLLRVLRAASQTLPPLRRVARREPSRSDSCCRPHSLRC